MHKTLSQFINSKSLAIIGVSSNRNKWGNMLFRALTKKGYNIYPIHQKEDFIENFKCLKTIKDIPSHVKNLIIALPVSSTIAIKDEIINSHLERIWMPTSASKTDKALMETIQEMKKNNICVVYDLCPLMVFPSSFPHRLHLFFHRLFGAIPKEFCDKH